MNTASTEANIANHPIVSPDRWIAERKKLLAREKELTHLHDRIAAERRALPWERIDKNYVFDTPEGRRTLADLFEGRSQLLVQHFMFGPDWEQGCPSCSFMADHTDGMKIHLEHRDITLVAVSRAPLDKIEGMRKRMDWKFKWVSSNRNEFNQDFHVSFTPEERAKGEVYYNYGMTDFPAEEAPGISLFYKNDAGEIFHTYSSYGRGGEEVLGIYGILDAMPKGRNEMGPNHSLTDWARPRTMYGRGGTVEANGRYRASS